MADKKDKKEGALLATSFKLSPEIKDLLSKLASHYGLGNTGVLSMLIKEAARKEGIIKK